MQVERDKTPYEQYVFFVNRFIEAGEPVEHKIIDALREPAFNYATLTRRGKEDQSVSLTRDLVNISDAIELTKKNVTGQDAILVQGLSQLNQFVNEARNPLSRTQKEWITQIEEDIGNIDTLQIKRKTLFDAYNKELERLSVGQANLILNYKEIKTQAEINEIEFRAATEMLDTVKSRRLEARLKFVEDSDLISEDEMQMNELPVIEIDERITAFYLQEYSGNPIPLLMHENHYTYLVTNKGAPLLLSLNIIDNERKEKRLEKHLMRHLMLSNIKEFAKYNGSFTLNSTTKKLRDFFGNIPSGDAELPVSVHTTEYYTMTREELFEKEQINEEDKLSLLLQLLLALYDAKSQFNLVYNRVSPDYLRYMKLDQPVTEERHIKSIKHVFKINGSYRMKLLHHDHLKKSSTEEGAILYLDHDDYTGFFSTVKSFELSEKKQATFLKAQKSKGKDVFKNLFTLFVTK